MLSLLVMHFRRYCEVLIQDIRYAVRSLRRSPGFTSTVILMLALAIGANTAIFSLLDRLLLRDLPYPDSNRIALVYEDFGSPRSSVAPANWLDWQRLNTSFESLAASNVISETLTGNGDPELVMGQLVSAEFFPTLKVQPTIGRVFTMDDDRPKSPPVVILSDRLWKRRFGGDPRIIGKTVEFDAVPKTIIGVMPGGFYFMNPGVEYWSPYAIDRARDWHQSPARTIPIIVGRLKPGVTLPAARAEMKALAKQLEQIYSINKNASVTVASLRDVLTDDVRGSVIILFAAVTLLLVIACINVAGMMLARASSRRREIAVRASLGAPRTALVRQLLVESFLLSLAAGGAGFLMALWGVSALVELAPRNLIRIADVSVDGWILLYTIGVCALTGVTFGLAPAIAATRGSLRDYLQSFGRPVSASTGTRQVLVVVQVIMTVILLCGAGLLARSLRALHSVRLGMESSQVLTMQITMPAARYDRDQQVEFVTRVLERLEQFPGVQSAGATRSLPVIGPTAGTPLEFKDAPDVASMPAPAARIRMATPGYFKTVGVPVVAGREFIKDDQGTNAEIVFIVNEAFVKAYLKGKNPLDSSMRVYMTREKPYGRIIGVTADVLEGSLRGSPTPTVFYNQRQLPYGQMTLYVRTTNPTVLSRQAVEVINQLDPNMAVTQVRALDEAFWLSIARDRLNAIVSASFAITALLLASMGLYGLLAFMVAERTREIGIRMALGAQSTTVLRMVMNRGFCLVGVGLALGLIAAFGISRFLEGLLFGVQPNDPATFVGVPLMLLIVTALAALVPANRATRVDPVVALRQE